MVITRGGGGGEDESACRELSTKFFSSLSPSFTTFSDDDGRRARLLPDRGSLTCKLGNEIDENVSSFHGLERRETTGKEKLTGTTFPTTEQLVLMNGVPPDIMRIGR